MGLIRESLNILRSVLSERVPDDEGRGHEYDPKEFDSVADYVGGHRMNTRNDPDADDAKLGDAVKTLRSAAKAQAGSGMYDDAAAIVDKLKQDKRFQNKLKHIGKGLPDDERTDKKPRVTNRPQIKPHVEPPDRGHPDGEYDEDDVKDVLNHLDKKYPGKWPFRTKDPRSSIRQALKDGPGSPSWRDASDDIDNAKEIPQLGLPKVSRRPKGKLGAALKQADQAKEYGHTRAKVGEIRQWSGGTYKRTADGWEKVKK